MMLANKRLISIFNMISFVVIPPLLSSCMSTGTKDTLASLNDIEFEVKEEKVDGSLEKAMASYQQFIEESPDTEMTPEAIRRLADMKVQKDYVDEERETSAAFIPLKNSNLQSTEIKSPDTNFVPVVTDEQKISNETLSSPIADVSESEKMFSERAGKQIELDRQSKNTVSIVGNGLQGKDSIELQEAGAKDAIKLYKGLLEKYPLFERNDQVLYQLSRAYEETGQIAPAMKALEQLISKYPKSRHIDEAQFRRAEYLFTQKKYLDAEESYGKVIGRGKGSDYYELALYKQGWAYFKQDLYEEALHDYIKTLDSMLDNGYELDNVNNKIEKKRVDDTYRVISLSFSYLGGAESVTEYFEKYGHRHYEGSLYSHLAEYYLSKRRYSDSAKSYQAYIDRNPVSKESPYFNIRIIEIYKKGGFPKLVVEAKQDFSKIYALQSNYWTFFDINEYPTVLSYLKSNLIDLANHYHALYQNKRLYKKKEENYQEAIYWYRRYLASFSEEKEAPKLNYQLAELLLENKNYLSAAAEYERTAYHYHEHEKDYELAAAAGYAAVFSYRELLKVVDQSQRNSIKREAVRSSLKFTDRFPTNKNAAVVLTAAVDDLYALEDYEQATLYGRRVIDVYPTSDKKLLRSSWVVVAHASFDTENYKDAEDAYVHTLSLTDTKHKDYNALTESLAASIYKQGEQARMLGDNKRAAEHFLRVAKVAPKSTIRPTAEYDAAASLIVLKQWGDVENILEGFRASYPKNKLNNDITRKLAVVYKADEKHLKAAAEFERIEKENTKDSELRREALNQAAELYVKANENTKSLRVYKKLVNYFPEPFDDTIEIRQKMADIYLAQGEHKKYISQLKQIVVDDSKADDGRTDRTRYLAANASLILTQPKLEAFKKIALVKPFKKNLNKKKNRMRIAIDSYTKLTDYQVSEVTAAATFYIAEIYFEFNLALIESERPTNLNAEELEEYELVIEDQAYPFEEKAIKVHEKNMELLDIDVYNEWIDKSIAKLAIMMPARYAKTEQSSTVISLIQPSSSGYSGLNKNVKNVNEIVMFTHSRDVISRDAIE